MRIPWPPTQAFLEARPVAFFIMQERRGSQSNNTKGLVESPEFTQAEDRAASCLVRKDSKLLAP
jgi:hypothetical protein